MSNELVSVCVPTRNRPELLKLLIESVLSQTHDELEVVITDNSDDLRTEELVRDHFSDGRIRYIRNPTNLGMNGNAAACLSRARGSYVTFTPDDDYWLTVSKLESQVSLMKDGHLDVAFSEALHFRTLSELPSSVEWDRAFGPTPRISEVAPRDFVPPPRRGRPFLSILTALVARRNVDGLIRSWQFGSEERFMWSLARPDARSVLDERPLVAIRDGEHNWEIVTERGLINYRHDNEVRISNLIKMLEDMSGSSETEYPWLKTASSGLWRHSCALSFRSAWKHRLDFPELSRADRVRGAALSAFIDFPRRRVGELKRRLRGGTDAAAPR